MAPPDAPIAAAYAACARARALKACARETCSASAALTALARKLRVRCSKPGCVHGPLWNAYVGVRCTVGMKRRTLWLRLPVAICENHRADVSLVRVMRRFAPTLLTPMLVKKAYRWPDWRRAHVIYTKGHRDLASRRRSRVWSGRDSSLDSVS